MPANSDCGNYIASTQRNYTCPPCRKIISSLSRRCCLRLLCGGWNRCWIPKRDRFMNLIERLLINLLLQFVSAEQLNAFLGDPQTAATIVGVLVAISGALLGTFLLLRKMSMTSDAISHTVLLGIVVTFLVMVALPGVEPDISSPFLIIGAALSGVAT